MITIDTALWTRAIDVDDYSVRHAFLEDPASGEIRTDAAVCVGLETEEDLAAAFFLLAEQGLAEGVFALDIAGIPRDHPNHFLEPTEFTVREIAALIWGIAHGTRKIPRGHSS